MSWSDWTHTPLFWMAAYLARMLTGNSTWNTRPCHHPQYRRHQRHNHDHHHQYHHFIIIRGSARATDTVFNPTHSSNRYHHHHHRLLYFTKRSARPQTSIQPDTLAVIALLFSLGLIFVMLSLLALFRFSLVKFKEWLTAQLASPSKLLNLPTSLL